MRDPLVVGEFDPAGDTVDDPLQFGDLVRFASARQPVAERAAVHILHGDPRQLLAGVDNADKVFVVGVELFFTLSGIELPPRLGLTDKLLGR